MSWGYNISFILKPSTQNGPGKVIQKGVCHNLVLTFLKEMDTLPGKFKISEPAHTKLVICKQGIERIFARLLAYRHLRRDYERLPTGGEAFIYAAMCKLMLASLTKNLVA